MVDPWSSMDSSNSPLTESGPSEDYTPSTSSDLPRGSSNVSTPLSPEPRRLLDSKDTKLKSNKHISSKPVDKVRSRDLTLELETLESNPLPRRPHFLDDDYQPSRSNIECRIPKPHFLDHTPSPDEFDERSDITNPNFLEDEVDDESQVQKKAGALPKKPHKAQVYTSQDERSHRTSYRSTIQYGLESAARSSERDKRAFQLYRGTWPVERDIWTGHDSSSVRSFSSNGSSEGLKPSNLENKMECVCSLISLLSLSPENNADLSGPLLEMSRSVESCIAMRQAGCIPLLVQLIQSKVARETRDRAAKALRNIIHTQTDDKSGRREARVWRLLEQVREYCYVLEDIVEMRKEGKEIVEDVGTKHPSQSVAALMKLSFDEEHRHVVCQLGGLQALASLVSGDQAAHGSRTDDNTCLTMRKYAGMTLTNLTFGDGNNKSLLCSFKDFMLALVEQLESPNDDMRQVTAAVLRNLSWRADTSSKQVLREVGAVKGLTKAAMTCQKEATLKSVLSALWNLTAHCSMNKVALCSVDGALGFLVDMLSYDSPTNTTSIIENSGGIIRNVSSHIAIREDYRQILRERNCLGVLLQHLISQSLTVVSNSCGTLWNLSARCPEDQQFLWDHGAVPLLRSLVHSKHKMISMGSSAALKNLLNSKPGKMHIISLDATARNMNLPALPTLGERKQKTFDQEIDQNLAETCDNIEPATSPMTSNREEKNLFTATERQIAMNLERHRMTSSSPLMGNLSSQISLSHSAHLSSYLSCSNSLLKGALVTRSTTGSANNVNRSDSKDSVTSTHSDSVFERAMRTGKVPVPTPRNKDLMKSESSTNSFKLSSKPATGTFLRNPSLPPVPPPRSSTELRTNYTETEFDVDQDSCDQPIDFSRKYSETKTNETVPLKKPKTDAKKYPKKDSENYGDYQETDLDHPTDYSLRYAEHQSENGSDGSEPPGPSVHEDTIKHFATEGTPYETPIIFSTATSMSDLRVIGKDKIKPSPSVKENAELMTHSDEKDTCSIEEPPRHDNERTTSTSNSQTSEPIVEKRSVFDTKFSSGMISPEKPVNYCDEGTPGYFSRVSSLSSIGEPTEEDSLAKRNAMATINVELSPEDISAGNLARDKEGLKAVTFACEPLTTSASPRFIEETPLMFSRTSSLGSLPECSQHDDQGSEVISEISRVTSGCISPSEIPDSPGASVAQSPPRAALLTEPCTPPHDYPLAETICAPGSVFEERVSRFVVENTPAHFSDTSLSSLTIDDEPRHKPSVSASKEHQQESDVSGSNTLALDNSKDNETRNDLQSSNDSRSIPIQEAQSPREDSRGGDSSPPSPASDSSDLLHECIQKGIDQIVKNKGPPLDAALNPYRDDVNRSLPPHLRYSTETLKMSHDYSRNMRDSHSPSAERRCLDAASGDSPPPLPPKYMPRWVPPRPPYCSLQGRKFDRMPASSFTRDRPGPGGSLTRNDSLSSLSLDSFGSTDREIFEETVQAGVSRALHDSPGPERARPRLRAPPSLPERAASLSSVSNDSFGSTDKEVFERCVRVGMSQVRRRPKSADRVERRRKPRPSRTAPKSDKNKQAARSSESKPKNVRPPAAGRETAAVPGPRALSIASEHTPRDDVTTCTKQTPQENLPDMLTETELDTTTESIEPVVSIEIFDHPNEFPIIETENTTLRSDTTELNLSNECLAADSINTTVESERDELNRSNESYAEAIDSTSDEEHRDYEVATLTRKRKNVLEWTNIGYTEKHQDESKRSTDTWNEDTCPDDVTFPTISGSVHLISSIRSEVIDATVALPDLLEASEPPRMSRSRPDLMDQLSDDLPVLHIENVNLAGSMLDSVPEPSYTSLVDDDHKYDSIISSAIEKEAARLAAQLKISQYVMENSATSLVSLDLDNVKPPSNLGSLLSLSASGQLDDSQTSKRSQRNRKKSLPVASMVKRALNNSMHQGSSEHLDSNPVSFLDNVKPPSEMENIDMEGSMISVSSIVSEVAEVREKTPIIFDFKQPIQDFPLCTNFTIYQDLDKVNPPSLFNEMAESTIETDQTTAQQVYDDCVSNTLNVVTDIPSGSDCTPLPSDISSVESTPKKQRGSKYLTPKEKRYVSKDRYQTYTITDTAAENDVVLRLDEEFVTWTRSESDKSEEYITATSEPKSKKKVSAKQRRIEDRARYQTQTVNIHNIVTQESLTKPHLDPHIESLKQRLAAKKTLKQKRVEDAERFRTRTLSEDIPPSPTFVTKDANFENVETTAGYDSLSSNEFNHHQLDERHVDDDVFSRDSGHNEDDFELNSTQMQTYTKSFRNYLPVIESPAAVDMCVVNNLKNIEMTASYRRTMQIQTDKNHNPSSGDFASNEGDSNSEDKAHSESDPETSRPKPKITKPNPRRDESLDSNESLDKQQDSSRAIRGKKKAMYVSPYRRTTTAKKSITPPTSVKIPLKTAVPKSTTNSIKAHSSAKVTTKMPSKIASSNTSPKKSAINKSPTKMQHKPIAVPPVASKPLPLERQGTFTKEESTVPAKDLPVPINPPATKGNVSRPARASSSAKPANVSPSRLPQLNRYTKPLAPKTQKAKVNTKRPEPAMKNSASNQSLQSNESGKTITIASRGSRQGSTTSVNSIQSKGNAKDVESKIANLWKKVEQAKKQPNKLDKRVWIESDKTESPKLIRSSTFDGQPKQSQMETGKQKSAIGIRVSQIPSLRPKSMPGKIGTQSSVKKSSNTRISTRKSSGQTTA